MTVHEAKINRTRRHEGFFALLASSMGSVQRTQKTQLGLLRVLQ